MTPITMASRAASGTAIIHRLLPLAEPVPTLTDHVALVLADWPAAVPVAGGGTTPVPQPAIGKIGPRNPLLTAQLTTRKPLTRT
jgi:hypothetical protein